jgi:very-short-patch-repair endonuclease
MGSVQRLRYIVDFYACSRRLVVEVDGQYRACRLSADHRRDRHLTSAGYRVLHLSASEVEHALPHSLALIQAALKPH